jgi:hypothetical protein
MNNINIPCKKYQRSSKENALCFIAGLCCMCILLYAGILLYPLAAKALEYITGCIGVMNNAVRGCYR